jgi:hypothetical protein
VHLLVVDLMYLSRTVGVDPREAVRGRSERAARVSALASTVSAIVMVILSSQIRAGSTTERPSGSES